MQLKKKVKSVIMIMSNKVLSRVTQLTPTSCMKKEQKKETKKIKQTQRRIHNPIKHQNQNHLQNEEL